MEESAIRPLARLIYFLFVVLILVVCAQIWVNPPEKRAAVACWPVYQGAKTLLVRVPGIFLPNEAGMRLSNISRTHTVYYTCTDWAEKLPGFDSVQDRSAPD